MLAFLTLALLSIGNADARNVRTRDLPSRAAEERSPSGVEDRWSSQPSREQRYQRDYYPGGYYGPQAPYPYYNYPGSFPPGPPFPDQEEADRIYRSNQGPPS